jgi:hypothetical protein
MNESIELHAHRQIPRYVIQHFDDPRILGPIIDYAEEPLLSLTEACEPLIGIVDDLYRYVSIAVERTPKKPANSLTHSESASIRLFTMEWAQGSKSLYLVLNDTLRVADRKELRPWFKYLKLFLTALAKLPCEPPTTVWRGVRKNISQEYLPGSQVTWWPFSSCTTTVSVVESSLYLGRTGERTLFSIEIFNGRNISAHSHFPNENETLLLPGTYMEVQSQARPAPDLYIIHLKQKIPEETLLEPPFKGILNIHNNLF